MSSPPLSPVNSPLNSPAAPPPLPPTTPVSATLSAVPATPNVPATPIVPATPLSITMGTPSRRTAVPRSGMTPGRAIAPPATPGTPLSNFGSEADDDEFPQAYGLGLDAGAGTFDPARVNLPDTTGQVRVLVVAVFCPMKQKV